MKSISRCINNCNYDIMNRNRKQKCINLPRDSKESKMEVKNIQKRVIAEIDLNALEENFKKVKGPVCCVVKADAYGHGAVEVSRFLEKLGANYFAVSNIEEAIEIRNGGVKTPIVILGYTPVDCAKELSQYNIDQCVYSLEYAKMLNDNAKESNVTINIHLKIDTGMGRIGFQFHDKHNELDEALEACKLSNLNPYGIFMHFAKSDEGINDYTKKQYANFTNAVSYLENNGIKFKVHHCANSGAILDYQDYHLDMVRAGVILYGVNPSPLPHEFKYVMSLKSRISHIKTIYKGDSVSYNGLFVADKETRVATIPVGYADGFCRESTGTYVMINDKKCTVIGRVCMDQMMVIVDDEAKVGDEVIIYGKGISVDYTAKYNKTSPYKVLCDIGRRVPRVYKYNGEIISIRDDLLK